MAEQMRRQTLAILKDLLKICQEEQKLFQTASDKTTNLNIKSLFNICAGEKEENAVKLKKEIVRLGGNPDLVDIKFEEHGYFQDEEAQLNSGDIIEQCIKADNYSLQRFSEAIKQDILWEVVPFVAKQYFGAKNMHDYILNSVNIQNSNSLTGVA